MCGALGEGCLLVEENKGVDEAQGIGASDTTGWWVSGEPQGGQMGSSVEGGIKRVEFS